MLSVVRFYRDTPGGGISMSWAATAYFGVPYGVLQKIQREPRGLSTGVS
jgi:hypothetical protein